MQPENSSQNARKAWLSALATAPADHLQDLWNSAGLEPEFEWLRAPESGAVMVRGRTGGTGAPFNLGEMTVTRCSLRLTSGEVGHGYVQGRDKAKARLAALVDASMQGGQGDAVRKAVIEPLFAEAAARRKSRAEKAAATKVEFFTMVRGED